MFIHRLIQLAPPGHYECGAVGALVVVVVVVVVVIDVVAEVVVVAAEVAEASLKLDCRIIAVAPDVRQSVGQTARCNCHFPINR